MLDDSSRLVPAQDLAAPRARGQSRASSQTESQASLKAAAQGRPPLPPVQPPLPATVLRPADLLTQILLGLRLEGVEYGRCLMRAPWAVAFPARAEARFHFVARGGCWLRTPGSEWVRLNAGDAVLLPRGSLHILASAPDVPTVDIDTLARRPVADNIYLVGAEQRGIAPRGGTHGPRAGAGDDGAATDDEAAADVDADVDVDIDVLFCGAMRFNLDPLHPLLSMMPDAMRANDLAQRDPTVPALLEAMEREVALDRIGACGILARMADVLAASIIRAWVECACSDSSGWIAAVQCPSIGKVIAAIHAEPERDWTVPMLADLMGASRSRFAAAFTRTVGESPARYVAKVKMFQARRWIAQEGMRVAVAADRLGYDSEASFSRAFKRIVGQSPGTMRRAATR
ncbi:AraC family transcriptional regulator [Roseateles aquatilis]|uniref:AraC family transcriptional regulator n=1 Tax=Roseateles aquatilis TaxID=431061 RepID=A0A246JMG0_9BURK|nr:AraC family transcriptional regulator [Roseateles aquatilis]OWQ93807.1 AraC family transcriptional regulator [Roseateles aquatilis]